MGCGASTARRTGGAVPISQLVLPEEEPLPELLTWDLLQEMRDRFWETRTDGNKEVWGALRLAFTSSDAELARQVIEAAELSAPHGSSRVWYDASGKQYILPSYIIADPPSLISRPHDDGFDH